MSLCTHPTVIVVLSQKTFNNFFKGKNIQICRHTKKSERRKKGYFSCSHFTKNFASSFCANIVLPKKVQSQIVTSEKLYKTLLYKKMLIKCC